jgi:exopolysaccharide biosynthesis polyprenyl glycosylphosphotransferase
MAVEISRSEREEKHAAPGPGPVSPQPSRYARHSVLKHPLFLVFCQLAIACGAYLAAWVLRIGVELPYTQALLPQERWDVVAHPWLILPLTQVFFLYMFGLFDDLRVFRYREIATLIAAACALQVLTITSVFFLTNQVFPRTVILLFGAGNAVLLALWHFYLKALYSRGKARVLIVGSSAASISSIIEEIDRSPWVGMQVVGVVLPLPSSERWAGEHPVLGGLQEIREAVSSHAVDQVIFASEETWKDRVLDSLSRLQEKTPLQIAIIPSVFEIVIGKLRHINIHDTPLIELKKKPNEPIERFVKRAFDIMLSAVLLLVFSPVLLFLAAAIRVFSPGPSLYVQERVGYEGNTFRLLKFRTMVPNAEDVSGAVLASEDDPRVTSIGMVLRRFRIDELPQLLNVLKGDMSFVGPRPERPEFVESFLRDVPGYSERHKVKPGLTGLAQVRSYYNTTAQNKLKYDLAYIYNYSWSLDLMILLETIKVVLIRKGS